MTPKQRESLETVLGYLDAYECTFCPGENAGDHADGCPVLELRAMVAAPQTLYDWHNIPKNTLWIARDLNGKHHGYEDLPSKDRKEWLTFENYIELPMEPRYFVEWQNSLEKRPSNL